MKLTIAGLHMEIGNSLHIHTETKLLDLKKYFEHVIDVDVSFEQLGHRNLAEVVIQANGTHLRAIGEGTDFYGAIDDSVNKLEKQLQKYKGRLNKHIQRRQHTHAKEAVLESLAAIHKTMNEEKMNQDLNDMPEADWIKDFAPVVKHKELKTLDPMTVDEAIMKMDLLHKPAFLFQNEETGQLDVVYREDGGAIKWVSPSV